MSRLKELRILSGGVNYLPPGDKLPDTDARQLENFRVDQEGALYSRNGTSIVEVFFGSGVAEPHTIARRDNTYYWGAGANLYRGHDLLNPIATGFSGNPLGVVSMNGFTWVMDRNVQGRDDGTTFGPWVIAAPATAPVIGGITLDESGQLEDGLTGQYRFYVTFYSEDGAESNPSPVSDWVTLSGEFVNGLQDIAVSSDARVTRRMVYIEGGALGEAIRLFPIDNNTDTSSAIVIGASLLSAANDEGIALEFDHDAPPAGDGMVGPYFSRLIAWKGNRFYWTKPGIPHYWPGADLDTGQWVDVGEDGDNILAVSLKARFAIVYKQRSIWRLTGDPDSGTFEIAHSKHGIVGPLAYASAGDLDYFTGPEGLQSTADGTRVDKISPKLDPVFLGEYVEITPGVHVAPIDSSRVSQCAMEYANGRLLFSYPEAGVTTPGNSATLIYHETSQRFATMRLAPNGTLHGGFTVLKYIGDQIWGGNGGQILQLNQSIQVVGTPTGDADNSAPITVLYQSASQDCGLATNPKVFTQITLDIETGGDALLLTVYADNGKTAYTIGSPLTNARELQHWGMPSDGNEFGLEALNLAVRIEGDSHSQVVIHAIYLHYYVEARKLDALNTAPFELAAGRDVEVKELQVDMDTHEGPARLLFWTDQPTNALTFPFQVPIDTSGRRMWQLPIPFLVEGRLFRLTVKATTGAAGVGQFRIYSARALARVVGTFVEAYEAAAGFVWDSQAQRFGTEVYRARRIELEIETGGSVTLNLLTDLPEGTQAVRISKPVNSTARAIFHIELPAGLNAPIEGRYFRLQISGTSRFKLYRASIEVLAVGVYLDANEGAAGALYDSRELDFGSNKAKEGRELELDIQTAGTVTVRLVTDLPSGIMEVAFTATATTIGRQKVMLPVGILGGRLYQLLISGTSGFALYGARMQVRPFGQYLTGGEGTAGAFWDSTELDLGTQQVKQLRQVEVDIWAYGPTTITVYTDLPGHAMAVRATKVIQATNGRVPVEIPLIQGAVPDNYIFGRMVRVTVASQQSVKLFGVRIDARAIGVYIDADEAAAGAVWDSGETDLGSSMLKVWDAVRFEMDSDGPTTLTVNTDLPGDVYAQRFTGTLTAAARSRGFVTVPLAGNIEGRGARIMAGGSGLRIYKVQVRARTVGRYIAAQNGSNQSDSLRTLDWDFGGEQVKLAKKLEVDLASDGATTINVYTNAGGPLALVYSSIQNTAGARKTLKLSLPLNTRGRLLRLEVLSAQPVRLYNLRAWIRTTAAEANWAWANYPLEDSTPLPEWTDLPAPPTPNDFTWASLPVDKTPESFNWVDFPVAPTDPQWHWEQVMTVQPTSDQWDWIDIPGVVDSEVG